MNGDRSSLQISMENHHLRHSSIMETKQWYIGFAMSPDAIGSDVKGRTYFKCWVNEDGSDLKAIRSHFINYEHFLDADPIFTTVNQTTVYIYQE